MTVVGQKVKDLLQSILYDGDSNTRFESDMQHVLPRFMGSIDDCISSCHHSTSSAIMTDEQLNFLLLNLHNLSKYLAEQKFPLVTQYEILQNVCGSIRDFHGLIVNGCIEHEIVECVLPQFQVMAERVGLFLWDNQTDKGSQLSELDENDQTDKDTQLSELDEDDQTDKDSQLSKLDEDDQTDKGSQLSELDEDDQTDKDSQLSELDEDDQTVKDTQLSKLDEDDQIDADSRLFKLAHLFLKTHHSRSWSRTAHSWKSEKGRGLYICVTLVDLILPISGATPLAVLPPGCRRGARESRPR